MDRILYFNKNLIRVHWTCGRVYEIYGISSVNKDYFILYYLYFPKLLRFLQEQHSNPNLNKYL